MFLRTTWLIMYMSHSSVCINIAYVNNSDIEVCPDPKPEKVWLQLMLSYFFHICYNGQLYQRPGFSYTGIGIGSEHSLVIYFSVSVAYAS